MKRIGLRSLAGAAGLSALLISGSAFASPTLNINDQFGDNVAFWGGGYTAGDAIWVGNWNGSGWSGGKWVTADSSGNVNDSFHDSSPCNTQVQAWSFDQQLNQYVAGPVNNTPNCQI